MEATKTARAAVFQALQDDVKYQRLFARKDARARVWNVAASRAGSMHNEALVRADKAYKRALKALQAYEDAVLAKAGLAL